MWAVFCPPLPRPSHSPSTKYKDGGDHGLLPVGAQSNHESSSIDADRVRKIFLLNACIVMIGSSSEVIRIYLSEAVLLSLFSYAFSLFCNAS